MLQNVFHLLKRVLQLHGLYKFLSKPQKQLEEHHIHFGAQIRQELRSQKQLHLPEAQPFAHNRLFGYL
jgi:hypothetical protein